jgi:hypothetical protein
VGWADRGGCLGDGDAVAAQRRAAFDACPRPAGAVAELADAGTVSLLGRPPEIVRQGCQTDAQAEPGPAAESQLSGVAEAEPGSDRPGAEADQRQAGAEVITVGERIARFYEEADRPVADFLMARGWTQERRAQERGSRHAGADQVSGER